jgi:hypothetical protein
MSKRRSGQHHNRDHKVGPERPNRRHDEPSEVKISGSDDGKHVRFWRSANFWLVIGTWVLAAIGGIAAYIAYAALQDTRHAMEISERAWLAPVGAELEEELVKDQPMKVIILFENSGKQPAINVLNTAGSGFTMPVSPEEAAQQQKVGPAPPAVDACAGVSPRKGLPIIYPSTVQHLQTPLERTFAASEGVLSGATTIFVHGCAAYETFNSVHHSEYCFWLSPRTDPLTGRRKFLSCLGGNRAD